MKIEKFGRAGVKSAIAALLSVLAIAIAQPSSAQPVVRGPLRVTVTCEFTPFWVFNGLDNVPRKAAQPPPLLGQSFDVIDGLRTTLGGFQYWETTVVVVEPGYITPGYGGPSGIAHYWLSADCALPNRFVPR